jgi:predicted transcriptional regulator
MDGLLSGGRGLPVIAALDDASRFPYSGSMEVHFPPELQAKLDHVAADILSGSDEDVQQLVEHYIDHDVWFRLKVKASLDQLDRGEFLTHEEVG